MDNENYYYYVHDEGGEITSTYFIPDESRDYLESGGVVLVPGRAGPDTHYVTGGALTARPELPVELQGNTLINVPQGAIIQIGEATYSDLHGSVDLEFDQPGTYLIRIMVWPYLDKELTFEN